MSEPHDLEKYSLDELQNELNSRTNKVKDNKETANKNAPSAASGLSAIPPMSIVKGIY